VDVEIVTLIISKYLETATMKVWINADNGSDDMKQELAGSLMNLDYDVHIGKTGSNVHYEDYFNVSSDYEFYITIYNGFCAGTVREAYSDKIQKVLKEKGVSLVIVWDSRCWLEGMKKYRYGDFKGYRARRAWDDNFSKEDPSIDDVDVYLRNNAAFYCVGPTAKLILEQFNAGGYFKWNLQQTDNS